MEAATNKTQPLEIWKNSLDAREEICPWPGPRPLIPSLDGQKTWRLAGRANEVKAFIATLQQHSLLVLHGASGVGKSSLLQIGLRPVMLRSGFEPIICSKWSASSESIGNIDKYMLDIVKANLDGDSRQNEVVSLIERYSVAEGLARYSEKKTVLVLDQFEEYIRQNEQTFSAMADWLETINKEQRDLRIVLSLRSDYNYVLDEYIFDQSRLRAFSFDRFRLYPIEDDSIPRVINPSLSKQFRELSAGAQPITEKASLELLAEWKKTGLNVSPRTILGLQAVLYALFWIATDNSQNDTHEKRETQIDTEHIELLRNMYLEKADNDLFLAGFFHTIKTKFSHCEQATKDNLYIASDIITPMAKLQLYRAVPLLSLGGFKVVQDLWALCKNLFKDELELMFMLPDGLDEHVFKRLEQSALGFGNTDLLLVSRDQIIDEFYQLTNTNTQQNKLVDEGNQKKNSLSDIEQAIIDKGHLDSLPWREDEFEITSGAMMGLRPEEVLVELLRIFWFAIIWLDESRICRVLKGNKPSITVVHDKLGDALIKWKDEWLDEPSAQIASLVETVGVNLDWPGNKWTAFGTGQDSRETEFLVNLRWKSCNIQEVSYKHVEFINCDFRSTRFDRCTFEGVTFVNCLLDGAMFDHCVSVGSAKWDSSNMHELDAEVVINDSLPAFSIQVDEKDVEPLVYYRGKESIADSELIMKRKIDIPKSRNFSSNGDRNHWLFSASSGVAARPASGPITGIAGMVPPPTGGLTLMGGRVSTLMFRSCAFKQDDNASMGSIAFVYVAGSSLEFVEQDTLNLEISWSALRGVTITRPVDRAFSEGEEKTDSHFAIHVDESKLGNVWLGGGLRGFADFENSTVFSLASLSQPPRGAESGFEVNFDEKCSYGFVYNTDGFVEDESAGVLVNAANEKTEEIGGIKDKLLAPNAPFNRSTQSELKKLADKADYRTAAAKIELLKRVSWEQ